MTVKELVSLFYEVDFALYNIDTQEYSYDNPLDSLPNGDVTSIHDAPWSENLIVNYEPRNNENSLSCVCSVCCEDFMNSEL